MSDFNYNFCTRDPRHPDYATLKECLGEEMGEPGVDCYCDSCFYGGHKLAVRIAELEALVEKTAEDGATVGWMIAEDRLRKRIAELEHQLAGCTCPTVAQLRRQGGE